MGQGWLLEHVTWLRGRAAAAGSLDPLAGVLPTCLRLLVTPTQC